MREEAQPLWDTLLTDFDGTLLHIRIDFDAMRRRVLSLAESYGVSRGDLHHSYVLEVIGEVCSLLEGRDGAPEAFARDAEAILREIELGAARSASLIVGVDRALAALRRHGFRVGVVTRNCRAAVELALSRFPLEHDVLLARDDTHRVKPDPAHLRHALALLGSRASRAIMMGDHPLDVVAGQRSGIGCNVGVLTGNAGRTAFEAVGASLILEDLTQILPYVGIRQGEAAP